MPKENGLITRPIEKSEQVVLGEHHPTKRTVGIAIEDSSIYYFYSRLFKICYGMDTKEFNPS